MKCRKIQEILKSDYLDGELSSRDQEAIKAHLAQCAQCRKVEEGLQSQRSLFQGAVRQPVPERVWQNIRESIVAERLAKERRSVLGMMGDYIFAPRPALVLASGLTMLIFVMFFAGSVIQRKQASNGTNNQERTEITNSVSDILMYDLGTDVEKYFL